jgi:hypothetical protein
LAVFIAAPALNQAALEQRTAVLIARGNCKCRGREAKDRGRLAYKRTAGSVAELAAVIDTPTLSRSIVNDSATELVSGSHRNGMPRKAYELTREVTIVYGAIAELTRTVAAPTLYRSVG